MCQILVMPVILLCNPIPHETKESSGAAVDAIAAAAARLLLLLLLPLLLPYELPLAYEYDTAHLLQPALLRHVLTKNQILIIDNSHFKILYINNIIYI